MESRITFDAAANESSILLIFTMLQLQNIQERQPFYDLVSVQQKIEQIRTSGLFIRLSTFTLTWNTESTDILNIILPHFRNC